MASLLKKYISIPTGGLQQKEVSEFYDCEEKGGKLLPRVGFKANKNTLFHYNDGSFDADVYFQMTDCHIHIGSTYGRIAIRVSDNMMDNITLYPLLITERGAITELGHISFSRIDSYTFGRPDNYTVFGGSPVVGKGIFFIAHLVYGEGVPDFVRVWELSEDMTLWIPLSEQEIYEPTLLKDGRGNKYFLALAGETPIDLPEPRIAESRNMLNSRFKATFTADSVSCRFALPLQGLDDAPIICTYNTDTAEYRWVIPADNYLSQDLQVGDKTVRLLCDRARGEVYFKIPDGIDFAPEYCGKSGNITVSAAKESLSDKVRVASKSACITPEGQTVKSSTAVTVFYGGWKHPNLVVWNSPVHPLYFPTDSVAYVGSEGLGVKKMATKDDILVAFKEDRVFAATLPTADSFSLSFKTSVALPDRALAATVAPLGNELVFATASGRLMRLFGATAAALRVEDICSDRISANATAFGLALEDKYALFQGDRAIIVWKRGEGYCRGVWHLGTEIIGGASNMGKTVLFARLWQGGINAVYPLTVADGYDSILIVKDGVIEEKELPIAGILTLELLERDAVRYRLYGIRVDGRGPVTVTLTDNTVEEFGRVLTTADMRGYLLWGRVSDSPKLSVNFSGELEGFALKYSHLNRM
ncbi:MAG: hypothetical protein J6B93_00780 [Clostridia bacterium]|nr:hypothetical protein [Clostridia bacterium]